MSVKQWLGKGGFVARSWKYFALATVTIYPLGIILGLSILTYIWAIIGAGAIIASVFGLVNMSLQGGADIQAKAIAKELNKRK